MNRSDFPILNEKVYGKPLIYLDNAATTQKPQMVIDALNDYYLHINSNIHRGVHCLSQLATNEFEQAREAVRQYINAPTTQEIIFTRGATESINLVANSFGRTFLHEDDEVIISEMEHHSNIVPWQLACEEHGAKLKGRDTRLQHIRNDKSCRRDYPHRAQSQRACTYRWRAVGGALSR